MERQFPELPGWTFDADEVSMNVYKVYGRDQAGRNVEMKGMDPDKLLERCRLAAFEMTFGTKNPE
jgi:hypothetical protein